MGIFNFGSSSSFDNVSKSICGISSSFCDKNSLTIGKVSFHPYKDIDVIKDRLQTLEETNKKQPRADNYNIINSIQVGPHLVLEIHYPNCQNYEGKKILVFKNVELDTLLLRNNNLIDPHFSDNPNFQSPIARFQPTQEGLEIAIQFTKEIL